MIDAVNRQAEGLRTLGSRTAQDYEHQMQDLVRAIAQRFRTQDAPATTTDLDCLVRRVESMDLDAGPLDPQGLRRELDEMVMAESVWFHHPDYLAHLNCPVDVNAVAAEAVLAAVNVSVDTFDQSRIGTVIERRVLEWVAGRIGFADGDGIFTSGGTQSNLHALFLAREAALDGLEGRDRWERQGRLALFTSAESHFSVRKSALVLGLPVDSVVSVASDAEGRMDPAGLRAALETAEARGQHPMAVSATAGTTDRGVIDPLPELGEVCRAHGTWFHVDAAYGGGLLVSARHGSRLAGLAAADSVTVDFHKTFFQPVSSSAVFLREPANFRRGAWHAEYLNPEDDREPNQVDKSLQTTRRFDALKLWATLRSTGAGAVGDALDGLVATTQQVHAGLPRIPGLHLLSGTDLTTVLFRWQPEGVEDAEADALVGRVREELQRSGRILLARTALDGRPCLKLTLLNPGTGADRILDRLRDVAETARALHAGQEAPVPEAIDVPEEGAAA